MVSTLQGLARAAVCRSLNSSGSEPDRRQVGRLLLSVLSSLTDRNRPPETFESCCRAFFSEFPTGVAKSALPRCLTSSDKPSIPGSADRPEPRAQSHLPPFP